MKINGKPDGGGGSAVITGLSVTENGIYIATGVDGYSPVEVDVPIPSFVTETLSVTSNGTYTPGEGIDGYSQVSVDVQPTLGTLSVSVNNTYYPGQGVDGFSQVIVDVPQSVSGFTEKNITEKAFPIVNLNNSASYVASGAFRGQNDTMKTVYLPNCSYVQSEGFRYTGTGSPRGLETVSLPICGIIDTYAFFNNTSMTSFYAPNVSYIDTWAFGQCYFMPSLDFPECISVGSSAFISCLYLESINLPKCTFVGNSAFVSCRTLSRLELPECITMGEFPVAGCSSLEYISCPKLSSIMQNTQFNCPKLSFANLEQVKSVTFGMFGGCSLLSSIIMPNVTSIGNNGFNGCHTLPQIDFPKCATVNASAFQDCFAVSYVNLPICEYLGSNAFRSCGFSEIDLPYCENTYGTPFQMSTLTKVSLGTLTYAQLWNNNGAFLNCPNLSQLYIDTDARVVVAYSTLFNNVTSNSLLSGVGSIYTHWQNYDDYINAPGWSSLSSLFVSVGDPDKPLLSFSDGVLSGYAYTLYYYTSYISVPKNDIITLDFPNVRYIGQYSFASCGNLTTINLSNCNKLSAYAFSSCTKLTTVNLGNCTDISDWTFRNCNINSLTIRTSQVCRIQANAFYGAWNRDGYSIYVPASLVDAYKSAQYWSNNSTHIFPIE